MDDRESAEVEALRRVPFFEDLTPEDLARVAKVGRRRRYDAGSATVTAVEPLDVLTLEAMYFRPFLIKNPSVAVTILEGVVDRLREVQERVEQAQGGGGTGP